MSRILVLAAILITACAAVSQEPIIDVSELKQQIGRHKGDFRSAAPGEFAPVVQDLSGLSEREQSLSAKESELLDQLDKGSPEGETIRNVSAEVQPDPAEVERKNTKTIAELKKQLQASEFREKQLRQELAEARNRLMFAETQVERLSNVLEGRNNANLAKYVPVKTQQVQKPQPQQQSGGGEDMPIATVVVEKAYLRAGPTKNDSPIMTVAKGTRLAIETRSGGWYRVIAPTGSRAWISGDVLSFVNQRR